MIASPGLVRDILSSPAGSSSPSVAKTLQFQAERRRAGRSRNRASLSCCHEQGLLLPDNYIHDGEMSCVAEQPRTRAPASCPVEAAARSHRKERSIPLFPKDNFFEPDPGVVCLRSGLALTPGEANGGEARTEVRHVGLSVCRSAPDSQATIGWDRSIPHTHTGV
jgi:hypothetical protein